MRTSARCSVFRLLRLSSLTTRPSVGTLEAAGGESGQDGSGARRGWSRVTRSVCRPQAHPL